ncbi:MAG TPA: DMT family transporter [Opitutaceae bacterium]|nr:DMT family transporter [Opitutaceae bacterium]
MTFPTHLLFPLASSFGYVLGVLLVKRASTFGVGLWRTTFVSNVAMGLCFSPLLLLGGQGQPWTLWWQPALTAGLFFIGQMATFLALEGDVSIATPVLGLKILLVALFSSVLIAESIPAKWWFAAFLSTVAIVLLNYGARGVPHRRIGVTVAWGSVAAAAYAMTDVLVQKWARAWGVGIYLPFMFGLLAVLSLGLIPRFQAPLSAIPKAALPWLIPGAIALAFQAASVAYTLAVYGDATAVNIVYSSRGLWSVIGVWLIGHWFKNEEQRLPPTLLRNRFVGAILMLAAIGLVVIG